MGEAAHTAQLNPLRVALLIGLYSGGKRELVLSIAPALFRLLTAKVGVIDFNAPGELLFSLVVLVQHDILCNHLLKTTPRLAFLDDEDPADALPPPPYRTQSLPQILAALTDDELARWPGEMADQERERRRKL